MERSPLRYAAVACVIAGGLLMGGSGAVAIADPGDPTGPTDTGSTDGTGTEPTEPDTTTAPSGYDTDDGSVYTTPTAGPVPAPTVHNPSPLGALSLPWADGPARWGSISLPDLLSQFSPFSWPGADTSTPPPAHQSGDTTLPQGTSPAADSNLPAAATGATGVEHHGNSAPAAAPPTISLLPLVPKGVPVGPPITIKNPLRGLVNIDLDAPILPQVLPPPIVPILTAMSEQIPLADLVWSPMSELVLPPLLADYILPALMSDVVVPTLPFGAVASGPTVPGDTALSSAAAWSLPASGPPPPEIAPVGMDMPLAPIPSPPPLPPDPSEVAPQPHSAPAPNGVAQLSEPVEFRAGYSDYLRNAGMAQITSLALPGIVGILLVTAGGGFIGYRQARAGHVIRAEGIARFLR